MSKLNYKLINLTLIAIAIYFVYKTGNLWIGVTTKFVHIFLPFMFAFALAYAIHPFLQKMINKKIPKWLGVLLIVSLILSLIAFVIYIISTVLVGQLTNLFDSLIKFVKKISEMNFDINVAGLEKDLSGIFKTVLSNIGTYVSNGAINVIGTSLNFISKFLIGAAAFVYFLIDMDKIRNGIKNFFAKRTKKTYNYVKELDNQMRRYLSGLVKVMLISVVEYTFAYTLIGHPNALLLGFLAGISNLIPYFGGMANNTLAAITAFVVSPALFIKTIITFAILSVVDSYVINANVYGKTNSIHPLIVIVSVFAGSSLFGILGIVISFPMAILFVTTYKYYKDDIFTNIKNKRKIVKE